MPCMDYESSHDDSGRKLKKQNDRLARIACAAMEELERNGIAEVIMLKNDELRDWWSAHKEADRIERERVAEEERKARVRQEALDRLSAEEKELLGLAPKKSSGRNQSGKASNFDEDVEPDEDEWPDEDEGEYDFQDFDNDNCEVQYHTTDSGVTVKTIIFK